MDLNITCDSFLGDSEKGCDTHGVHPQEELQKAAKTFWNSDLDDSILLFKCSKTFNKIEAAFKWMKQHASRRHPGAALDDVHVQDNFAPLPLDKDDDEDQEGFAPLPLDDQDDFAPLPPWCEEDDDAATSAVRVTRQPPARPSTAPLAAQLQENCKW